MNSKYRFVTKEEYYNKERIHIWNIPSMNYLFGKELQRKDQIAYLNEKRKNQFYFYITEKYDGIGSHWFVRCDDVVEIKIYKDSEIEALDE